MANLKESNKVGKDQAIDVRQLFHDTERHCWVITVLNAEVINRSRYQGLVKLPIPQLQQGSWHVGIVTVGTVPTIHPYLQHIHLIDVSRHSTRKLTYRKWKLPINRTNERMSSTSTRSISRLIFRAQNTRCFLTEKCLQSACHPTFEPLRTMWSGSRAALNKNQSIVNGYCARSISSRENEDLLSVRIAFLL